MRTFAPLAVLACLILLATPAVSSAKTNDHVGSRPAYTDRQGGDTIATAVEVTVPFAETGATGGYADDYDEVCPYTNSTSPDVVYTFVTAMDMAVDFDMIGSAYDTKIYLYDEDLNLVACNDDFHSDYTSKLENIPLNAGVRYYLVIDGYGGDFGEYVVAVCENYPCAYSCASDAVLEGEPAPHDGYVDQYNGGCDVDPPVFQTLYLPMGEDELVFCGSSGWYDTGGPQRDSDWFELVAVGDQVDVRVHAPYTFGISVDVMYIQDCQDVSVLPFQLGSCGFEGLSIPTTPGELVRLRVRPTSPTQAPCAVENDIYELYITGLDGVVAVEETSWSALRQLYR